MTEHKTLEEGKADRIPFTVPEGYFNSLHDEVMAKIAKQDTPAQPLTVHRHIAFRPWIAAAASVCVAVIGITAYLHKSSTEETLQTQESATLYAETQDTIEEADEYIMMDNEDIYAYLANY